jgi:phosphoribosyl 1,2-cyclic phosphodiesterase
VTSVTPGHTTLTEEYPPTYSQGGRALKVTFYGVRGSTPCPCEANRRYGGNTACVSLEVDGEEPIVLDIGTGLRFWGETLAQDGSFAGSALVTHLHWDHVQGLPFFVPVDRVGARLDIYAPEQEEGPLKDVFDDLMRPPYFPVRAADLRGDIRFHGVAEGDFAVGNAKVKVRNVPHPGATVGYRVEWDGTVITYISDHQEPMDGSKAVSEGVRELCDGADLLIHDAQYTPDEFEQKKHWGHCTVDFALEVARVSGVRTLALFHHDPARGDDAVDRLLEAARARGARMGLDDIVAASEGLTISY